MSLIFIFYIKTYVLVLQKSVPQIVVVYIGSYMQLLVTLCDCIIIIIIIIVLLYAVRNNISLEYIHMYTHTCISIGIRF